MRLGDFLKAAGSIAGPWNCSTLAADWCVSQGYPDFAAEWRGIIDEAECDAVATEAGGLELLWDRGIGEALPVVGEAEPGQSIDPAGLEPGDILIVALAEKQAGAIWTGQRLALKAPRGLHFLEPGALRIDKAWRP